MEPLILYRCPEMNDTELQVAQKYFKTITQRSDIISYPNHLIIPRYTALPYFDELVKDVQNLKGKTINNYSEHLYCADMKNWYEDLIDYTPKTYFQLQDVPDKGPFIVKGQTNSKKFLWDKLMFADNKKQAIDIAIKLKEDTFYQNQDIYVREYISLLTYMTSIHNLPITKEFRFFCYNGKILSGGFYWSSHVEDLKELNIKIPDCNEVPPSWLKNIVKIVGDKVPFYVIDVAQTLNNEWIVIEVNDAQMSGLSQNDPDIVYYNLKESLTFSS